MQAPSGDIAKNAQPLPFEPTGACIAVRNVSTVRTESGTDRVRKILITPAIPPAACGELEARVHKSRARKLQSRAAKRCCRCTLAPRAQLPRAQPLAMRACAVYAAATEDTLLHTRRARADAKRPPRAHCGASPAPGTPHESCHQEPVWDFNVSSRALRWAPTGTCRLS